MLNKKELLEKLDELGFTPLNYDNNDYDRNVIESCVGPFNEAARYGGEGQGDQYWAVLYFVDHDVYLRANGWYASFAGGELDGDWYAVVPKEKTVIVYEVDDDDQDDDSSYSYDI